MPRFSNRTAVETMVELKYLLICADIGHVFLCIHEFLSVSASPRPIKNVLNNDAVYFGGKTISVTFQHLQSLD